MKDEDRDLCMIGLAVMRRLSKERRDGESWTVDQMERRIRELSAEVERLRARLGTDELRQDIDAASESVRKTTADIRAWSEGKSP